MNNNTSPIIKVKIKFNSFDEYVGWALEKLKTQIPGLSVGAVLNNYSQVSYRRITYELSFGTKKFNFDFEMESDFEWYSGNKQEDPDWIYSPKDEQYKILGGVTRLVENLRNTP